MMENVGGRTESTLDFPKVVFMQIGRILQYQAVYQLRAYQRSIEGLETILEPFMDDGYKTELKKIEKTYETDSKDAKESEDTIRLEEVTYLRSKKKFRQLMRLAGRAGLLPARRVEEDEE